jgi:hypothetical protein
VNSNPWRADNISHLLDSPHNIKVQQKRGWHFVKNLEGTPFLPSRQPTPEHLPRCPNQLAKLISTERLLARADDHLKQHWQTGKGGRARRHALHS